MVKRDSYLFVFFITHGRYESPQKKYTVLLMVQMSGFIRFFIRSKVGMSHRTEPAFFYAFGYIGDTKPLLFLRIIDFGSFQTPTCDIGQLAY